VAKGVPKFYTPIKTLDNSTLTHEEGEEIHNEVSKLQKQFEDLKHNIVDKGDLENSQNHISRIIEDKMEIKIGDLQRKMIHWEDKM